MAAAETIDVSALLAEVSELRRLTTPVRITDDPATWPVGWYMYHDGGGRWGVAFASSDTAPIVGLYWLPMPPAPTEMEK